MKTEINNSNKAKFFAQYWGQQCLFSILAGGVVKVESYFLHKENLQDGDYLQLKPLLSITEEDVIQVAYLNWPSMSGKPVDTNFVKSLLDAFVHNSKIYQYLQSKGYALPWMGLSVDEMVQAEWIKLI